MDKYIQGTEYPTKYVRCRFNLIEGTELVGRINMVGYDRVSDYIEKSQEKNLKIICDEVVRCGKAVFLYSHRLLIVPKQNILYVEILEES
jgi:hypothetical protein